MLTLIKVSAQYIHTYIHTTHIYSRLISAQRGRLCRTAQLQEDEEPRMTNTIANHYNMGAEKHNAHIQ